MKMARCIFGCDSPAALYDTPEGCACFDDVEQWRCFQHALRAQDGGYPITLRETGETPDQIVQRWKAS